MCEEITLSVRRITDVRVQRMGWAALGKGWEGTGIGVCTDIKGHKGWNRDRREDDQVRAG